MWNNVCGSLLRNYIGGCDTTWTDFGGSVDVAGILDFVDSGRDLILAADGGMSDFIRDLANECGVEFDEVYIICAHW